MNIVISGLNVGEYVSQSGVSESSDKVYDTAHQFTASDGVEIKRCRGVRKIYNISLDNVPLNVKNMLRSRSSYGYISCTVGNVEDRFIMDSFSAQVIIQNEALNLWSVSFSLSAKTITGSSADDKGFYSVNCEGREYTMESGEIYGDIQITNNSGGLPKSGICASQMTFSLDLSLYYGLVPGFSPSAPCTIGGFSAPTYYITGRKLDGFIYTITATDRTIFLDLPFDYTSCQWDAERSKDNTVPTSYVTVAFTYPLPDEHKTDHIEMSEVPVKHRGGIEIIHATKDNPVGVAFAKKRNTYEARLGNKYNLVTYKTFEEVLEIRQIAEVHYHSGDLDEWYAEFKAQRTKEKITYARLDKHDKNGKISYAVVRNYQRIHTNLGRYSYEEALNVKTLADSHIDAGDFDEWAKIFYAKYKNRIKAERRVNLQKIRHSSKSALPYAAVYAICKYINNGYTLFCYDTSGSEHLLCETSDVEEAYKTMDLANEHIEAGDFNAWFADYKN